MLLVFTASGFPQPVSGNYSGMKIQKVHYEFPEIGPTTASIGNRETADRAGTSVDSLSDNKIAYYKKFAGIYIRENESRDTVGKRLLSLTARRWSRYTWGADLPLGKQGYGSFDYSRSDKDFVVNKGNGGENPLGLLLRNGSKINPDNPMAGWVRVSSPENPQWLLKEIIADKKARNEKMRGRFLSPVLAYSAIENTLKRFLQAWGSVDRNALLGMISKKQGLSVHIDEAGDQFLAYDAQAYKDKDWLLFGSEARTLFGYGSVCDAYPNLFINEDINEIDGEYPGSVLVELQPKISTAKGAYPTEDILSIVFVNENDDWVAVKVRLSVNLE